MLGTEWADSVAFALLAVFTILAAALVTVLAGAFALPMLRPFRIRSRFGAGALGAFVAVLFLLLILMVGR